MSPSSSHRPAEDSLSDNSDSGHTGSLAQSLNMVKLAEQDTFSDESGYSEEPLMGKEVTAAGITDYRGKPKL